MRENIVANSGRVLVLGLFAGALVTLTGTVAAGTATATTNPCYATPNATNCDNQDPQATGCNADAYTASSKEMYWFDGTDLGTIQNRYSPHCGSNWTRFVPNAYPPSDTPGFGEETIAVETCLNDEFVTCSDYYSIARTSSTGDPYSNMVYAPNTTATANVWIDEIDKFGEDTGTSDSVDA